MVKHKAVVVFAKAQVAAFVGGLTDYVVMIALTELAHIHYTRSILISGLIGAVVNFSLNRRWAFQTEQLYSSSKKQQLLKFLFVVLGSISLKSIGTYLVTTSMVINYKFSRLITDAVVSYGFNFPLMKYWVFRKDTVV